MYNSYPGNYSAVRGISRAKGVSRSRSRNTQTTYSGSAARKNRGTGNRYSDSRRNQKGPGRGGSPLPILIGCAAVIAAAGIFLLHSRGRGEAAETTTAAESRETFAEGAITKDMYLDYTALKPGADLMNLRGMTRDALSEALKKEYSWNLTVRNTNPSLKNFTMPDLPTNETKSQDSSSSTDNEGSEEIIKVDNPLANVTIHPEKDEFKIPDLLSSRIDQYVESIFSDYESRPEESSSEESESSSGEKSESSTEEVTTAAPRADYELAFPDLSSDVSDYMDQLALVWKMDPENGDITSFNKENGEFEFGGSVDGYSVDADKTADKVMEAINSRVFDETVDAVGNAVPASTASIRDQYQTIGSYSTTTTSNAIRNTNIKLAAAAINGTIVKPGQEFSFNETVGQRTEKKGYGGAPAYNSGEVVNEVGGGVCQVSTTLYNAVFRSGLTTTYRRSHSFAPNYVTPGMDATVSWPGPDYKFVNNSSHAIGIRAWYSDNKMSVQIYGIRILPEGESWELVSEKVKDLPVPEPQIITPQEGKETKGSAGSEWQAYKIITKSDGTTQKVEDHYTRYKGHTPKTYSEDALASIAASEAEAASAAESQPAETTTSTAAAVNESPTESTSPTETTKAPAQTSASPEISDNDGGAEIGDGPVGP